MNHDETTWSPGLASMPGVSYTPPPGVRGPSAAQREATPTVLEFEFDGETRRSLSWKTQDGSTSASPASRFFSNQRGSASPTSDLLRELHAGLARPGTPTDYHFAIQHVIDELWKRRKEDPQAISEIEPLCLTDISLIEAYPDAFRSGNTYYAMTSTRLLVKLYENAGDLDAALALARRVAPFLNGTDVIDRLEAKRARLAEEDAP